MDSQDRYDFYNSDNLARESKLDRGHSREPVRTLTFVAHDEPRTLFDVIDAKSVVTTLELSIAVCLTAAAERDGITLSPEQIQRFAKEAARNSAQTVLALEIK